MHVQLHMVYPWHPWQGPASDLVTCGINILIGEPTRMRTGPHDDPDASRPHSTVLTGSAGMMAAANARIAAFCGA